MTLTRTLPVKSGTALRDALRLFARRPLAFWGVGWFILLPELHPSPSAVPEDVSGLQALIAHPPSPDELKAQILGGLMGAAVALVLAALAWPVVTLLAQDMDWEEIAQVGLQRVLSAFKAFCGAVLALCGLALALMLPSLVAFVLSHQRGTPFFSLPSLDAMGFWSVTLIDTLLAVLVVAMVGGALLVVPAEACVHPAPARDVVRRVWVLCRDQLGGLASVLVLLQVVDVVGGLVADGLSDAGSLGRLTGLALQAALAPIAPLVGVALHATLSKNAVNTGHPGI